MKHSMIWLRDLADKDCRRCGGAGFLSHPYRECMDGSPGNWNFEMREIKTRCPCAKPNPGLPVEERKRRVRIETGAVAAILATGEIPLHHAKRSIARIHDVYGFPFPGHPPGTM